MTDDETPGDLAAAIDARLKATLAAGAARRARRKQQRQELNDARTAGLPKRHRGRLQRQGPQVDTPAEMRRAPRAGRCPECQLSITPGELIARSQPDQPWHHAACINPDQNT